MAKKAADDVPESITMTKAEAVRQALAQGIDAPGDIQAFIKHKFDIDMTPQTISSYKSMEKNKNGKGKKKGKPQAGKVISSGITADLQTPQEPYRRSWSSGSQENGGLTQLRQGTSICS